MKTTRLQSALALACAIAASPAGATTYHLVDLGENSVAYAINRKGEIAGESPAGHAAFYTDGAWREKRDRQHASRAFAIDHAANLAGIEWDGHRNAYPMYYPRGQGRQGIPLPGGSVYEAGTVGNVAPLGISPDGTKVVGSYKAAQDGNLGHCFSWAPGDAVATDLGMQAGYQICNACAVNDDGIVVGQLWGTDTGFAAFVYSGGTFRLVGPTGLQHDPELTAVNAKGHATGDISFAQAVYWNGRKFATISPSGPLNMVAGTAIDDHDNIVGWGWNGNALTVLMYTGGELVDLVPLIDNVAGWDFSNGLPTGISEAGTIVGYALFDDGSGLEHTHGYMLVPDSQQ
jgi:uncharacterized membrane protein